MVNLEILLSNQKTSYFSFFFKIKIKLQNQITYPVKLSKIHPIQAFRKIIAIMSHAF